MKKLISFLLFVTVCLSSLAVFAKSEITNYKIIIPPQFEEVRDFSEGYAAVKSNGKWGYVNKNGEFIIPPKYDYAASFSEGKALCAYLLSETWSTDSEWDLKLVDYKGNEIDLDGYSETFYGFAVSKLDYANATYDMTNTYDYWFNNGYITIPCNSGTVRFVFDSLGTEFDRYDYTAFNDGVIAYNFSDGGYVCDKNKNKIIEYNGNTPFYNNGIQYIIRGVYCFYDNYGTAYLYSRDFKKNYVGIIDKSGNLLYVSETDIMAAGMLSTNPNIDFLIGNMEGIFCTSSTAGKLGAVDMNGNTRVPFIYDGILPCNEGLIPVKKDEKWGYVDTNGKVVIEPQYEKVTAFNGGMALVVKDDKPYIIDRYNDVYANYEKIDLSYYFKENGITAAINENTVIICENEKYGFAEFDYSVALPKKEEMSDWAHEEVTNSIENNLVPIKLRSNYSDNIDRADFATLIVNVLKKITEKTADEIKAELLNINPDEFFEHNPFNDITDEDIIIANKLGIINGVSADTFNHANSITRQDAAVMIMRLAKYLNLGNVTEANAFADDDNISDYAKDAVKFVTSKNIMKGTGNNEFSPLSNITREQAYITVMRTLENFR